MTAEPKSIDVSSLAELVRNKHDADVVRERLEKMEATKEKVSSAVYRRVKDDYEKRRAALEAEAEAPRGRAGREYAKLRILKTEAEKAREEARLDNEELEFRRELGEFAEEDYKTRLAECQARLGERQKELDDLTALKDEFLKAFHTEEDLERAASSPGVVAAGAVAGASAGATVVRPAATPAASPLPSSPETTIRGPLPPPRRDDVPASEMTMTLTRLILLVDDKPEREFILKREPMSLGRSPENAIHIPYPDVSRQHASLVPEADGRFKVIDRGSPNGVFVNGERIREHVLASGDIIQVGRRKLLFRS